MSAAFAIAAANHGRDVTVPRKRRILTTTKTTISIATTTRFHQLQQRHDMINYAATTSTTTMTAGIILCPGSALICAHSSTHCSHDYESDNELYDNTPCTYSKESCDTSNKERALSLTKTKTKLNGSWPVTNWLRKPRWFVGRCLLSHSYNHVLSSNVTTNPLINTTTATRTSNKNYKNEAAIQGPGDEEENMQRRKNIKESDLPEHVADEGNTSIPSIHLQLTDPNLANQKPGKDQGDDTTLKKTKSKPCKVQVHTFQDSKTNSTWKALNTSKRKFVALLQYQDILSSSNQTLEDCIETQHHTLSNPGNDDDDNNNLNKTEQLRIEWRILWKAGRLVTDRTELLAVYPSDTIKDGATISRKRGGFADLLHLYTGRLLAMLHDEQEDTLAMTQQQQQQQQQRQVIGTNTNTIIIHDKLVSWLERHYGKLETERLYSTNFQKLGAAEQLFALKHFLEWFRSFFPYFYDRCGSCGASIKEDIAASTVSVNREAENNENDDEDMEHQTFIGYIYPDQDELLGKASRTELYQCHVCHAYTRFPRFNSATHVMDSRRGRCGEYSMLLFRFLRALQLECRWVVDWSDHVWAEVLLSPNDTAQSSRWLHLDPCEAAVDENLIYQGWGKKQTFLLGFYLPPLQTLTNVSSCALNEQPTASVHSIFSFPLIEDITQRYTSDSWDDICQRREETTEQVESAIHDAIKELEKLLLRDDPTVQANNLTITMQ